jgi:hypothetical protein
MSDEMIEFLGNLRLEDLERLKNVLEEDAQSFEEDTVMASIKCCIEVHRTCK